MVLSNAIGCVSDGDFGDDDLSRGTTRAFFQSEGKNPDSRDSLMREATCGRMLVDDNRSISADIPSAPALEELQEASTHWTSSGVIREKLKGLMFTPRAVLQPEAMSGSVSGVEEAQTKAY